MRMQQKLLQAMFSSVILNHRACKFNEVVSKLLYSVIILQVHDVVSSVFSWTMGKLIVNIQRGCPEHNVQFPEEGDVPNLHN